MEPVSPALAGRLPDTGPPGKSHSDYLIDLPMRDDCHNKK